MNLPALSLIGSLFLLCATQSAIAQNLTTYTYTGAPFDVPSCQSLYGGYDYECPEGRITGSVTFRDVPPGFTGVVYERGNTLEPRIASHSFQLDGMGIAITSSLLTSRLENEFRFKNGSIVSWYFEVYGGADSPRLYPTWWVIFGSSTFDSAYVSIAFISRERIGYSLAPGVWSRDAPGAPPQASFTFAPQNPVVGEVVTFTSTSTDADGHITQWQWNFGDGQSATGATISHRYTTAGQYTVTLTVTDNDGLTDSASQVVSPEDKGTLIVFGNGVRSTRENRAASLMLLQVELQDFLTSEEASKLSFDIAHNNTGIERFSDPIGSLYDFAESAYQSLLNDTSRFYRFLSGLEAMPDWFQKAAAAVASDADATTFLNLQDLRDHVSLYTNAVLEGKRVIVVPHSQGNFFANEAYARMDASLREHLGIVSVANPDSFVAGGGHHTTLYEDLVIVAIRLKLIQMPMLPNVFNYLQSIDPLGHSFIDAYMHFLTNSKVKILADIRHMLETLPRPPVE